MLLSLDDLLAVTREFIHPEVSRSGLDRCLRRHGVSNLEALIPRPENDDQPLKTFKDDDPGFIHVDVKSLPNMPDEEAHRSLFVAIDRASRWVDVEIHGEKTAANAPQVLQWLVDKAPFKIQKIFTDNGKEFTDRFCPTGERDPTGQHLFDRTCDQHAIEHRLIKPDHPQTNGMVERLNGRIGEVLATTRFDSAHLLEETLIRDVRLYHHQIPQKALGHISPVQALKKWQERRPELFKKKVYNLTGRDTYA